MILFWIVASILWLVAVSCVLIPVWAIAYPNEIQGLSRLVIITILLAVIFTYFRWGGSYELSRWYGIQSQVARIKQTIQKSGNLNTLIQRFKAVVERNPNDPQGWVLLGRLYLANHEDTKARSAFEQAARVEESKEEDKKQAML